MSNKMKYKKNFLPFAFSFFTDFMFYYSFYVSLFASNKMSAGNLATLFIISNISKMIADIPVGFISDIISRRNVLILGLLLRIIFCLLCLIGEKFYIFAISMIFAGFGNSCIWIQTWNYFYDYKKNLNETEQFPHFMGKFYAISNLAIAFAGFVGIYIFKQFSFSGIFIGSIISMTIAIIIIFLLPNYKPATTIKTAKALKVSSPLKFLSLLSELLKKPKIMRLLLLTILADAMFIVFLDVNTTLMNVSKFTPDKTSLFVGIVSFIRIFSNYFSVIMHS